MSNEPSCNFEDASRKIAIQDWGRSATLRLHVAETGSHASSIQEFSVHVIPQSLHIAQMDMLARLEDQVQGYLIPESEVLLGISWTNCELVVDTIPRQITSVEKTGDAGWLLLQTRCTTPPIAA